MHRIRTWIARFSKTQLTVLFVLLAISTSLSLWMITEFTGSPGGYASRYATGGAFVFACIFALASLVLIPWRQTRRFGLMSLASGVWLIGSYLCGSNIFYRLDLVAWKGERIVSLLPEQGTGYYIYFQPGTSDPQIEDFLDRVLSEPPSPRGRDLKAGIRSYARLSPVVGRKVVAIGLQSSLTSEQRRDLRLRIQSERIVSEVSETALPGGQR